MKYRLSICIPTRNRAELLRGTLESIATSKVGNDNIQVVVSDNNSSDDTYDVAREFEGKINLVYVKHGTTLNIDESMLAAAKCASGDYVFWLGDDDLILSDALKRVMSEIEIYSPDLILLNANFVLDDMTTILGCTINDCGITGSEIKNEYSDPRILLEDFSELMPFGTFVIQRDAVDNRDLMRFNGTYHLYTGLVFDYLCQKFLNYGITRCRVIFEPLVSLRTVEKSWKNETVDVFFRGIFDWYRNLNPFYKESASRLLSQYSRRTFCLPTYMIMIDNRQLRISDIRYSLNAPGLFAGFIFVSLCLCPNPLITSIRKLRLAFRKNLNR